MPELFLLSTNVTVFMCSKIGLSSGEGGGTIERKGGCSRCQGKGEGGDGSVSLLPLEM